MRARTAAQKQLMDDIKAAVGDQRFADYQRATNSSYRQASQLVGRLELPPETANQVYALQQDLQQRAGTIRRSAGSAEAAMAELTALAAEAKAKVTAALGDRGFEAYKQNGGQWLQNLAPRPPPPKN